MRNFIGSYISLAILFFWAPISVSQPIQQFNVEHGGIQANNSGPGTQYNHFLYFGDVECNGPRPIDCKRRLSKFDSLSVKIERYLVATNPTELEVSKITLEQWYGDTEPFITAYIRNSSKLPAERVDIGVVKPKHRGQKESQRLALRSSRALSDVPASARKQIFIQQGAEISFPVGAQSELFQHLNADDLRNLQFLGVGMSNDVPREIDEIFRQQSTHVNSHGLPCSSVAYQKKTLAILLKYQTIFGQKRVRLFPLYFYFGKDMGCPALRVLTPSESTNNSDSVEK